MATYRAVVCGLLFAAVGQEWLSAAVAAGDSWQFGVPCTQQHTLRPSRDFGESMPIDDDIPYTVDILDEWGHQVWFYRPGDTYTIRLTGKDYFRAFAFQMRLATKQRFVIGHLRAGEFYPDASWSDQGVKILDCAPVYNNSVTNTDFTKKFAVEVKWRVFRNYGPIQFFSTIMQEQARYWSRWSPKTGFLLPDDKMGLPPINKAPSASTVKSSFPEFQKPPPPQLGGSPTTTDEPEQEEVEGSGEEPEVPLHILKPPSRLPSPTHDKLDSRAQRPIDEFVVGAAHEEKQTSGLQPKESEEPWLPPPPFPLEESSKPEPEPGSSQSSHGDGQLPVLPEETQEPWLPPPPPLKTQESIRPDKTPESPEPFFPPGPFETSEPFRPETQQTRKPFAPPPPSEPRESIEQPKAPVFPDAILQPQTPAVDDTQEFSELSQLNRRTGAVSIIKVKAVDQCESSPCQNNATCVNLPEDSSFYCECPLQYTGELCQDKNYCAKSDCRNGAICKNEKHGRKCDCRGEWAGDRCDRSCPAYLCDNGGKCIINQRNDYDCACAKGWVGKRCDQEANECRSNPCKNGGRCVDKFGTYVCECVRGFMGKNCHRPCQDIYNSCAQWEKEDRCEVMRPVTKFFDINCARTCQQCNYSDATVHTTHPIPPSLEPFTFLVGRWVTKTYQHGHWPADFTRGTTGYAETWEFSVPPVPMFGTPSINFTARAVSKDNPRDQHITYGFLTLNTHHQEGRPHTVALMSSSNSGIVLVEEGTMKDRKLELTVAHQKTHPFALRIGFDTKESKRTLVVNGPGPTLQETVEKRNIDGTKSIFTKSFTKIATFVSF